MGTRRDSQGRFLRGPGRPKGSPNRLTASIRAMIEQALHEEGGVDYLRKQARENPPSFLALVAKLIPKDVRVSDTAPGLIFRDYTGLGRERIELLLALEKELPGRALTE